MRSRLVMTSDGFGCFSDLASPAKPRLAAAAFAAREATSLPGATTLDPAVC
jgi:hypothetical protein